MATPNYTPSYNQYLTHTAGYALPSSVRSYSVFDPSSNSWRRMTNDGRSPMPVQGQTPVADALALARQTQGRDWSAQPAPVQTPAQTPLGGPRMASNRQLRGGMGDSSSQPSTSPRGTSMSPAEAVAFDAAMQNPGANLQVQPRVFMPLESRYENFQQEIPRSNAYGPLQNPRTVRNMSPDYQETAVQQPMRPLAVTPGVSNAEVVQPVVRDVFDSDEFLRNAHRSGKYDAAINEFTRHLGQMANASAMFAPNALYNVGWQANRGLAKLVNQSPTMNRFISPLLNRINTTGVGQGTTRLRNIRTSK